jgi:hypothetical protein
MSYPIRARRAGLEVVPRALQPMQRRQPGSTLVLALCVSTIAQAVTKPLLGYLIRQAHSSLGTQGPDRQWERVKLRLRGECDGLRGRMGRPIVQTPRRSNRSFA